MQTVSITSTALEELFPNRDFEPTLEPTLLSTQGARTMAGEAKRVRGQAVFGPA